MGNVLSNVVKKNVIINSSNEIIKLKGIGPYTSSAISSFAFKEKVAVVDGNVFASADAIHMTLFRAFDVCSSTKDKRPMQSLTRQTQQNQT